MVDATKRDSEPIGANDHNWQPQLASGMRLQFEQAQDAWVLLYPEGMVQLNTSAAEILRRCDGTKTITAIVTELQALFNVSGIESEVQQLAQEAKRRGWLI
ncbi:MAG TPA: pyrroloquinoline quinone biosynthesis peptide chaperone PqqD [Orrella sp.]